MRAGLPTPPAFNERTHLVPATTIDETVARLSLDRLDFIKMDIGYALRGGRESLARFGPRMAICIYHRQDDRVAVPQEVLAAQPACRVVTSRERGGVLAMETRPGHARRAFPRPLDTLARFLGRTLPS